MNHKVKCLGKGALVILIVAIMGGVVMLLWNWVIPAVFDGGRPIDFLHALGLLVLSRILFGGFRGHGGWHGRRHWRKWEAMTPEERERFQHTMSWARRGRGDKRHEQADQI